MTIDQNVIDRSLCDLTQVPLYIQPAEVAQENRVDFSAVFPVIESIDYESANQSDVPIHELIYRINESLVGSQFEYQNNIGYNLVVDVKYSIGSEEYIEIFSLVFSVVSGEKLEWGDTNVCEYRESETIDSRGGVASLILP